jgi:hypothetical protein
MSASLPPPYPTPAALSPLAAFAFSPLPPSSIMLRAPDVIRFLAAERALTTADVDCLWAAVERAFRTRNEVAPLLFIAIRAMWLCVLCCVLTAPN